MKDINNFYETAFWHSLSEEEVLKKLDATKNGLYDKEVKKRRGEFGFNVLPTIKPPSLVIIFLRQFLSPLIYILIAAGLVSAVLKEISDAFFIFIVIFLNAIVGSWQENKAEKTAGALKKMIKINTTVIRNGFEIELDSAELVPGDIIKLSSGHKVPADARLLEVKNLTVDQSLLTGESRAVEKDNLSPIEEKIPISAQENMIFAGTTIATGRALAVIVKTGLNSEIGKIAKVISSTKGEKTPLILRMENFTKKISFIMLFVCLILMVISLSKGMSLLEVFFLAIALAVAVIPEGLPVALTVALSIASFRMSKRNVLVRRLNAVEGLGSCTLIASDKTGTLTVNQQTAKKIWLPSGASFEVEGEGYNGQGKIKFIGDKDEGKNYLEDLEELCFSGAINNEAELKKSGNKWHYHGDSMDVAFLALAIKKGIDLEKSKKQYKEILSIPYESENRFSAILVENQKEHCAFVKGAVEVIVQLSSHILVKGKNKDIDKEEILKQVKNMASQGYRVLAVAKKECGEKIIINNLNKKDLKKLVFLGLVGFIDPLRAESKKAVEKCRGAGIEVAMITGDHPLTAMAIAKELNIAKEGSQVITGEQIQRLGPSDTPEFYNKISACRVFAEVSPMQKYQIVEALRKSGHFVAVTGDGANDAPALKRANLGVAMGSGTDVAKETSSMIVLDDNFSSIVAGVEEGRFAYDNVRKVIYLLISTGCAEIMLFFFAIFAGLPLPLFAVQLLWLNLVTEGIQYVALAFEAGEPGAMSRPPRSPKEGIFDHLMIQQTLISGLVIGFVAFSVWFVGLRFLHLEENIARNFVFLIMIMFENLHALNCRSERRSIFKISLNKNRLLVFAIIAAHALHIFAMYNPYLSKLLRVSPITLKNWIILFLLSFTVIASSEIFKYIKNKKQLSFNYN